MRSGKMRDNSLTLKVFYDLLSEQGLVIKITGNQSTNHMPSTFTISSTLWVLLVNACYQQKFHITLFIQL